MYGIWILVWGGSSLRSDSAYFSSVSGILRGWTFACLFRGSGVCACVCVRIHVCAVQSVGIWKVTHFLMYCLCTLAHWIFYKTMTMQIKYIPLALIWACLHPYWVNNVGIVVSFIYSPPNFRGPKVIWDLLKLSKPQIKAESLHFNR